MTFDQMRSLLSCATTSVLWTVLVLVHLCLAEETKEHFPKQFDFRIISYDDLVKNAWQFQHPDLANFTKLTIDASNDQLLVGSRDSLFRLSLDNLSLKEYVEDDAADPQLCRDKGLAEKCHNYIQVLQLLNYTKTRPDSDVDHAVFICGTNALSPVCTWRPANNLSRVLESTKGLGKTSYDPLQNSTTLVTSEGDIYGATYNGVGERDPVIYRTESTTSRDLRTAQANSKWLNEPDFISSYEIGDLVYFFFREVAVEFINCGKKTYSRVARICKTDQGGMFESTWTTFFKSRLNCSLPGEYPFYYEELQGTFLLEYGEEHERQKYIFAVFNTPMNSIAGSAVCMYSMKSFNESFSGPFKHQESPRSAWERHEQPDNGVKPLTQCQEKRDHSKRSNNLNMDDSKYQLMDNAVQPVTLMPYVHADNERWTHVVVDYVTGQHDNKYTVVFVATEDGKLLKMAKVPGVEETCLIEEIKIVPNGHRKPVKDIKIASKELAIYISTHNSVIKIPVHRCGRFTSEDLCLNAKDPYCGWDVDKHQCITLPVNRTSIYWRQEIDGCPVITRDINGGWSEWSSWGKCQQVGGDAAAGPCLCRSRSCDNPKPFGDGLECYGANMEVTNCTVHGQWTEWSSWSQCTQSCGSSATRMRYRYCSNPPPRNGGNDCLNKNSKNSEEEYCQGNQPCPLPPIKSNWTEWAEWSECSAKCNGGIQTRRRSCVEPPGPVNKVPCTGNTQEWRMCNTQICEELHQMTPWTPWIPTNQTRGGYFENRFRFMCKATVPSQSLIKTKGLKTQTRFCVDGGQCHTSDVPLIDDIDGGWSDWTVWSSCSRDCGGGYRWRQRECNNPRPLGNGKECHGHPMEGQECHTHSCKGIWGCWSAMSSCSVTCGQGEMIRTRTCDSLPPGRRYIIPCDGKGEESVPCDRGPCINIALSSSMSNSFMEKPRFSLAQMFLVGGLSFFLGGSASIAVYCYVSSFRRAMKDAKDSERKKAMERRLSQQRQIAKRQSQVSMRIPPSMSSQVSLDNMFIGRSKVYDVENVMRESGNVEEHIYSTIDKKCPLKTFTIKDL